MFATPAATAAYASRIDAAPEHFRRVCGLTLSSIGLGTYLGEPDDASDAEYTAAVRRALELGVNVIDTAINYRFQRSERAIGLALRGVNREEVFISTKAGFLTPDGDLPANPRVYFEEEYFARNVMRREDLVAGMHCMTPGYLENQIERSRRNLRLDTIDLFYLHNPETQLSAVAPEEFARRIYDAFVFLEQQVQAGAIRWYGAATWNGFRVPPTTREHLPLEMMVALARQAGGEEHHFRFVQLPHNLGMPEALTTASQTIEERPVSLLEAAAEFGITVMASGTLRQAALISGLPQKVAAAFPGLRTDAQRAIQFTRSTPGVATALVGMGQTLHVEENLELVKIPPAERDQFMKLFG